MSGNASIGMLMLAVAGLALPAALRLSSEMLLFEEEKEYVDKNGDGISDYNDGPSFAMIGFSRFNAVIMVVGYVMYLLFQLGTHGEEFEDLEEVEDDMVVDECDEEENPSAKARVKTKEKVRKNKFCRRLFMGRISDNEENESGNYQRVVELSTEQSVLEIEMPFQNGVNNDGMKQCENAGNEQDSSSNSQSLPTYIREKPTMGHDKLPQSYSDVGVGRDGRRYTKTENDEETVHSSNVSSRRRNVGLLASSEEKSAPSSLEQTSSRGKSTLLQPSQSGLRPFGGSKPTRSPSTKSHCSDASNEEQNSPIYNFSGRDDEEECELPCNEYANFPKILIYQFLKCRA